MTGDSPPGPMSASSPSEFRLEPATDAPPASPTQSSGPSASPNHSFPQAVLVSSTAPRIVSKLWWLTGLSLMVAIVLVISSLRGHGPRITIQFADGHGLKVGDTLRYRGITVGEVTDVALIPKLGGVTVTVNLDRPAASLARKGSEFWIERPRVSLARVSGLETVVGAKYLGVHPGPVDAPVAFQFEGIESPPTMAEAEFSEIAIHFSEGYGLQPGDPVRHRGIVIGEVTTVDLDRDLSGVSVRVRLSGMGHQVAREGSLFWVERPRVSVAEVRGLETLVGGRYVAVSPGAVESAACDTFAGLDYAPVAEIPAGGIEIVLHAPQRWGIDRGVPISYRGLRVGQVHSVGLSSDGTRIEAKASIEARYRTLVRRNSVFWSTSGIDFNFGLTGLQLTADTLSTIAQGGIAFATPEAPGELANSGQRFAFERAAQEEWTQWNPHISLLNGQRSGDTRLPEPQRAVVRWTEKSLGFSRGHERSGWVVLLDNQRIIGPADILLPTERPIGDIVLEVAGLLQKLDPKQVERTGLIAMAKLDIAPPDDIPTWPAGDIRVQAEPEDVFVIGNPQSAPHPLAASSITSHEGAWVPEASGLNPTWHGAPVVSGVDARLVGMLVFNRGKPLIVTLPVE